MKIAYFETNVINWLSDQLVCVSDFIDRLTTLGFLPVTGPITIYELARTFLDKNGKDRGSNLFSILKDISPSYHPDPGNLMTQEIIRLRTSAEVLPFLDSVNQAATRLEVERLSRGIFDSHAEKYIRVKEESDKLKNNQITQSYMNQIKEVNDPTEYKKLKTFPNLVKYFESHFPEIIRDILNNRVSLLESKELYYRLNEFPVIKSSLYSNLYLTYLSLRYKSKPGHDRFDDHHHVINASYSHAFITGDIDLIKTIKYINPNLTLIKCSELMN